MNKYYTAICFTHDGKALKYRCINNLNKFEIFAKTKNVAYINYYFKSNKLFSHRTTLTNK